MIPEQILSSHFHFVLYSRLDLYSRDGKNANFSLSLVIVILNFKKSLFIVIYTLKIVSDR